MTVNGQLMSPSEFYKATGAYPLPAAISGTGQDQIAQFIGPSTGLTANPRSSNLPSEVVTDDLVNAVVGGFTINTPSRMLFTATQDLQGRARANQAQIIMVDVISRRLQNFVPLGDANLGAAGQPALDKRDAYLDADRAECAALSDQFGN